MPHGVISNAQLLAEQQRLSAEVNKLRRQVKVKRVKQIAPRRAIGYIQDIARTVKQQPIQNNGGAMGGSRAIVINRFNQPPIIRRQPEQFEARDTRQPLHNHFEHHSPDVYDDGDGIYLRFFDVERKLKSSAKNTGSLFGF